MLFFQPIEPQPGQESVWDYPRPPRIEPSTKSIRVVFNDVIVAESIRGQRVLETSHPPAYYIPPEDVNMSYFQPSSRQSYCEWKGVARYYTIIVKEKKSVDVAWYYPNPTDYYAILKNYLAFYPSRVDACYLNGEKVTAQAGDFYGGWITQEIVGPFKGGVGTGGW